MQTFPSTIRLNNFGYKGLLESTEATATFLSSEAKPSSSQAAVNLIDSLMGAPYHRNGMLRPHYAEVGFGLYEKESMTTLTINFARTTANTQGAPNTSLIAWPPDKSTDLPTTLISEAPNPITENNGAPAGYAASVQVSSLWYALKATTFEIRENSTGILVDTKLLSYDTDFELRSTFGDSGFIAALPRRPLTKNTTYKVNFEGFKIPHDNPSLKTLVRKTWTFTTGDKVEF